MTSPTPPPLPPLAPAQRGGAMRRRISPRTVILSVVLVGSILFFFLILFVGLVAILQEAAPRMGPHVPLAAAVKHAIAHQIARLIHHK